MVADVSLSRDAEKGTSHVKAYGDSAVWPHLMSRLGLGADTDRTLWLALPPPNHGEVAVQHASHLMAILRQVTHYGGVPLYKNQANLAPRLWFTLRDAQQEQEAEYEQAEEQIPAEEKQKGEALPSIIPSVEACLSDQPAASSQESSNEAVPVSTRLHSISPPRARDSLRASVEGGRAVQSPVVFGSRVVQNQAVSNEESSDSDLPPDDSDNDSFGPFTPKQSIKRAPDTPCKPTRSPKPAKLPKLAKTPKPTVPVAITAPRSAPVRPTLPQTEPIVIEDDEDNGSAESSAVVRGSFEEADEVDELIAEADQVFPLTVNEELELWNRACLFFGHATAACDPQNPEHRHRVVGLRFALRPDQMWSVFRMLSAQELTGLHGTLLADGFGLGKTLQATAVAVVAALVHMAKIEVMGEWTAGDQRSLHRRRHLPQPTKERPQTDATQCPSGTYRLGFACPCVKRLPTYNLMRSIPGPGALFIVPPSLLAHWTAKLAAYVDLGEVAMFPPRSLEEDDDDDDDDDDNDDGDGDAEEKLEKRSNLKQGNGPFFQLVCVRAGESVNRMAPDVLKRFLMIDAISAGMPSCAPFLATVLPVEGKKKKDEASSCYLSSRCQVPCPLVIVPSSMALANAFKISSTAGQIQQVHKRQHPELHQAEIQGRTSKVDVPFPFQPSMVFIDESHKVKGKDTFLWKVVRQLVCRSQHPLFVYPCSATPTPKDANDLECFVDILARPFGNGEFGSWSPSTPAWLRRNTAKHTQLVEALQAWHSQSKSLVSQAEAMSRDAQDESPAGQAVRQRWRDGLRKQAEAATARRLALFKRVAVARAGDHRFLGKYAIQKLPLLQIEERTCPTGERVRGEVAELSRNVAGQIRHKYHEYVQATKKRRGHKKGDGAGGGGHILTLEEFASGKSSDRGPQTLFYDLHLCAVFPALARLIQSPSALGKAGGAQFDFRKRDFAGFRQPLPNDGQSWTDSPYWPYVADIGAHSSKLAALRGILDAMRGDTSPHRLPSGRQVVLAKRAVVFTARPPVAYMVALALHHHYGRRLPVSLVLDTTTQRQRRQLYAPFEGPVGDAPADADDAGVSRVLITTIGTSAEGLDLTRASYAVILEPYWNHDQERQALGRVQRAGQCASRTHLYKLLCPDNIAERLVQCRQMGRRAATQGWDMHEALGAFLREN